MSDSLRIRWLGTVPYREALAVQTSLFDYGTGQPDIVTNEDYAKGDWLTGEIQYTVPLLDRHHVVIGTEYRNNFRQEQGNYDVYEVYLPLN